MAVEGIVEHNNLVRKTLVTLEIGDEEGESERGTVARAQGVLETGPACWGLGIAEVNGGAVDDQLIA